MDGPSAVWGILSLLLLISGAQAQSIVCGNAPLNDKTRIVGGETATAGAWPWQVSLQRNGGHFCGGSLVGDNWVVTAAHCFQGQTTSGIQAVLGEDSLSTSSPNQVSRSLAQIIIHPDYNPSTFDNDICLLRLSSSVSFTNYIQPVCVTATNTDPSDGSGVWVTGWGTLSSGGSSPDQLQEVNVPIVPQATCRNSYSTLTDNMICAGEEGRDSCQGDSGGPLVYKINNSWALAGVVSFGQGCAQANFPGVYARTSRYMTWISDNTGRTTGFIDAAGNLSSRASQLCPHLTLVLSLLTGLMAFYLRP